MNHLIALGCWVLAIWLIRKDTARRDGISRALWIPTLWVGILLSRPLSMWLGFGGGSNTLEGSPLDRAFFLGMIILALSTLSKRNVNWSRMIPDNWPIFLFYGFLLISVLWAESPFVSFKRWFKDLGNIFVAAVILTEVNPQQAVRAVFARCAYLLLPLSVVFLRYFPSLGRTYSIGGGLEVTGVTTQKNSLGVLALICGLILLWDWFERPTIDRRSRSKLERYLIASMLPLVLYVAYLANSTTSILCMIVAGGILFAARLPALRTRVGSLGAYCLIALGGFYLIDSLFGIKEGLVQSLGRDMTFTGRTEVWAALLDLKTDPVIGTGFCSIWSDRSYLARLPEWVGASAHNGYLETYLDGGMIGICFLVVMLLAIAIRSNRRLAVSGYYSVVRFAVLLVMLIGNFSESHFGRMTPLGFLFLLTALDVPRRGEDLALAGQPSFNAGIPRPVPSLVSS